VLLPPGRALQVLQPLPQPPTSHAAQQAGLPPHIRLLLDVLDAQVPAGLAGAGRVPQLTCEVRVAGPLAALMHKHHNGTWGMATRAVVLKQQEQQQEQEQEQQGAAAGGGGPGRLTAVWQERFVVNLPPGERWAQPAPAPVCGPGPTGGGSWRCSCPSRCVRQRRAVCGHVRLQPQPTGSTAADRCRC
jgi:hypothetical protein